MTESRTSFEIALPGPTLDSPLLFARHAERIKGLFAEAYPSSAGYRVTTKAEMNSDRQAWEVNLRHGWLSGVSVAIRPLRAMPHRAQVDVRWDSRLCSTLTMLGGLSGLPIGVALLLASLFLLHSLLFTAVLLAVLIFIWVFAVAVTAQLVARAAAAVLGNVFDRDRRATLADEIRAMPVATQLEARG